MLTDSHPQVPLPVAAPPTIEGLSPDFTLERRILEEYEARIGREGLGTLGAKQVFFLFF